MPYSSKYPLWWPSEDDHRWGIQNDYESNDKSLRDCLWLMPPYQNVPAGFKITIRSEVEVLKKCIGWLYPNKKDMIPTEKAIPVYINSDNILNILSKDLDNIIFKGWEDRAIQTGNLASIENKEKVFNGGIPIIPPRYYHTFSEKHKWAHLQRNFEQFKLIDNNPPESYLTSEPKELEFDPVEFAIKENEKKPKKYREKNLLDNQGEIMHNHVFQYDLKNIQKLNLDIKGRPMREDAMFMNGITTKKNHVEDNNENNNTNHSNDKTVYSDKTLNRDDIREKKNDRDTKHERERMNKSEEINKELEEYPMEKSSDITNDKLTLELEKRKILEKKKEMKRQENDVSYLISSIYMCMMK